MRIVHVSDCYLPRLGGIEQQVSGLAAAQLAAGHEVHVVTATRHAEAPEAVIEGVQVHRLTAPLPFDLPLHPRAGKVIHERLAELSPDVVHVHIGAVSPFSWAGLRAADALSLPSLTSVHSIWGPLSKVLYGAGRRLLNWPDSTKVSAVSRACAAPVQSAADCEVQVIGNGVDLVGWSPIERVPSSPLRLVSATRFAPRKRVFALLRLVATLVELEGAQAPRLTIAGSGVLLPWAKRWVKAKRLQGFIELPGRLTRSQLVELYAQSDIFVQLSVRESFGIAAVEARATGLPVVGRNGTGFSEFVTDGVNGFLLDSDAQAGVVLAGLSRDIEAVKRLQAASCLARPEFDWPQVLLAVESGYASAKAQTVQPG